MRRVIFVDIDGVLNCDTTTNQINGWDFIDDDKVALLADIIHKTNSEIVISSDWRFIPTSHYDENDPESPVPMWSAFNAKLTEYNLRISDMTGPYNWSRGHEILEYVSRHDDIERWIALDDIHNLGPAEPRHVFVSGRYGLTREIADKAIEMMNNTAAAV